MMLAKSTGHSQGQVIILGPAFSSQSTNYKAVARYADPGSSKRGNAAAAVPVLCRSTRRSVLHRYALHTDLCVCTCEEFVPSPDVLHAVLYIQPSLFWWPALRKYHWNKFPGHAWNCLTCPYSTFLLFQALTHKSHFQKKKQNQRGLRHRELIYIPVLVVSTLLMLYLILQRLGSITFYKKSNN